MAAVVICANPGEDEDENLALPAAAITTLQQSAKYPKQGWNVCQQRCQKTGPFCMNQQKSHLAVKIWKWGTQIIGGLSI